MAKIPVSTSGLGALGEPPPPGTYLAVCIDVIDQYGVVRKAHNSEEMETVDLTRFVFGLKAKNGQCHKIASRPMTISGGPKANLTKFIKMWTGRAPRAGLDTEELKGKGAQITVTAEENRNGKTYNNLTGIAPVMDGLEDKVPAVNAFADVGGQSEKSDDSEFEVLGSVKGGGDPF